MTDAIHELTAREIAARTRRGDVTAVEVLEAHLARIDALNSALNAVVSLDADGARDAAARADAAREHGADLGPLHGVPLTLKDGFDVAGLRTTVGTAALDRVATEDSTVAARLRAAGAILVGHTNVPPWLGDHQTANPLFGRTANPWDAGRTSGGSSGGAAAAVAAGLTPLEVGSDMVSSIRLPASFCGIYGLKTTEHRVPMTGFFRQPGDPPRTVRMLSCPGPMARDLDDLELALAVVSGPDGYDSEVPPVPLVPEGRRLADLRIAVAPALPGTTVAAALRGQVERVAARASDAGAQVGERLPDLDWDALGQLYGDLLGAVTGILDPASGLRDEQRSLAWYFGALQRRDRFITAWQEFFTDVDVVIVPPAMTTAFPHCDPGSDVLVDGAPAEYFGHGMPGAFANLTGLPALAVPAGQDDDGLPAGVQLVGPLWSETRLIAIARELEATGILPGFRPPPV